ncbi:MAG TPA: FtsX-like permease family protein, partial [Blastocatellia bacterium]|nr:FtsX-like permease family protein [Blastocatellia bacterium]
NLRTSLLVLLAVVVCVLFIACMNVANLLLGRGVVRQKELAIRAAMGSSRARLVRQLLSESVLLSVLGTIPGILLAFVAVRLFRASSPIELPPGNTLNVNLRVLAFAAFLSVLTAFVFGLVPALKASRVDLNEVLKSTGRTMMRGALSHRAGTLLVISQVAVSFVLVTAAVLFIESLVGLHNSPLGFRVENLLTARVDLPAAAYPHNAERVRFYDELISRLTALPSVQGAAVASSLPLGGRGNGALIIQGKPEAVPDGGIGDVGMNTVGTDYFRVAGIPVTEGREFDSRDREDSQPVALVNEALVERYFTGTDPIGKRIKFGKPDDRAPWLTIIGIVGNDRRTNLYNEMELTVAPFIFRPASQAAETSTAIVVRMRVTGPELAALLENEVLRVDGNATLYDVRTMDDRLSEFFTPARFRAVVSGVFASLAVLLASIGIYGVLSQSTLQRRQEIGIRMALGAQPRDILRLVIGQGLSLVLIGVGTGLCATLALTRFIASLLYGVKPTDLATLLIGVTLLIGIAVVACYLPARRAIRVDPMAALRCE